MTDTPDAPVERVNKIQVLSWSLWDFGSAAFNAVLVTFIFSVYLVDSVGAHITHPFTAAQWLSLGLATAGVVVAGVTPVLGQRADLRGTRRRSVTVWTYVTVVLMAVLFFVRNNADWYFFLGLTVLAVASVTFEFAEVNYFAQLSQISTRNTVGKISGFGWASGYVGGIFLLLLCYVGFVAGDGTTRGLLGIPVEGGLNIRLVAVMAALWFGLSAIALILTVPEITPSGEKRDSVAGSYRRLFHELAQLWRADRNAIHFLIASAVFRDGLAGVFTYGAILGVSVYGLAPADVLIFGIAANVTSALGAAIGGFLDDLLGPKPVIMGSLLALIISGTTMFFLDGPLAFWICGLLLCLFVGPAQSASRSFLLRVSPSGRDGQMFGFYATTGRAISWLSPVAFFLFVSIGGGDDRWGVLGIVTILALGLLVMLRVHEPDFTARTVRAEHVLG